jgi:transposase InsO family protein
MGTGGATVPWKETCSMDQRVAFIGEWLRDEWTMTELAERYGVSRKTAYKWVGRYEADPEHGLITRSRAPHAHGRACDEALRAPVLALRRRHPHWGPKKLRAILQARRPATPWPAASTMGAWLRAAGLSEPRRRRRYVVPLTQPLATLQAPNDVWTADFKGWFRTRDGTRCDPLTIADAHSRYVLCCRIVAPSEGGVRPWFERTFREYGLPGAIRTDNGAPFASLGPARLTRLAVWWLKLGIQLDRIDPGHPEQNGRHERFHLTLQQETTMPPAPTPRAQQQRFDRMRLTFNTERPHEALGQHPPAQVYTVSRRSYPTRLEAPHYDGTHQVRRVKKMGWIQWGGDAVFVSKAVRGELVGIAETEHGDWTVRFMHLELGRIDRKTRRFTPSWQGQRE